ncbi:beta strand repeat-containing protein [Leifsonia poae]|uniref:beta strand repeat-containing protein n=1 Tax=Leifsonia poae TaxID=110933 RepID=UPI001CC1026A|nr:carboxypeptidase regulatory-like domain-containing protein [Leifsonia poae]
MMRLRSARPHSARPSSGRRRGFVRGGGLLAAAIVLVVTGQFVAPAALAAGTATIGGTVTDASTGLPIAGVVVDVCAQSSGQCSDDVATATDGTYSFSGLDADRYTVSFTPDPAGSYIPTTTSRFTLAAGGSVVKNVALATGGSISGRVTDADGAPIVGVNVVRIESFDESRFFGWFETDADGRYRVTALPAGSYQVAFASSGFLKETWNDVLGFGGGTAVMVAAGADTSGIDAVLARSASISGVVRAGDGSPVSGVMYGWCQSAGCTISGTTDGSGAYTLPDLAAGTYSLTFDSGAPFASRTRVDGVVVSTGQDLTGQDVTLLAAATLSGTLTGPSGPLVDSMVALFHAAPAGGFVSSVQTDSAGHYTFTQLDPGAYTVQFQGPAGSGLTSQWWSDAPSLGMSSAITLGSGDARSGVDATLGTGVWLFGTVTGSDAPTVGLGGVTVNAFRSVGGVDTAVGSTVTDSLGRYRVPGLGTGSYKLQFVPSSGAPYLATWWSSSATQAGALTVSITSGVAANPTDARLSRAGSIAGTLTGADDGAVVAGATVTVYSFTLAATVATTVTDGSGAYSVGQLAAGQYGLRFDPPSGSAYGTQWYTAAAAMKDADRITLTAGQALTGRNVTLGRWLTATPTPTISGVAGVGETLTAAAGDWLPAPVDLGYQWYRGSTAIGGATGQTYTIVAADLGAKLTVRVTGTKPGYNPVTTVSAATATVQSSLTTAVPTITGTAAFGSTLTAVPGTWGPAPVTFSYQWKRDGVAIAGSAGTGAGYTLVAADLGTSLTVAVTGKKTSYASATVTSAPTASVTPGVLTSIAAPVIAGTAEVGQTLTATDGTWSPSTGLVLLRQWSRDGVPIPDATAASYVLVGDDAGSRITVVVTATTTLYAATSGVSAPTALVTGGTLISAVPTISGLPNVGHTLTASPGVWTPSTVFSYQWARNGVDIAGATAASYVVTGDDAGAAITVSVTGSKAGFTTVTVASPPTGIVTGGSLTADVPVILGPAVVGGMLLAVPGAWGPSPVALAYHWARNGTPIAGATMPTYLLTAADAGGTITVGVTGSRPGYDDVTTTSLPTALVNGGVLGTQTPTVSGRATVGAVLTATVAAWSPAPVALTFQWLRDGVPIGGATASQYIVAGVDRGARLSVAVTGDKPGFGTVTATSAAGDTVTEPPHPVLGSSTFPAGATVAVAGGGFTAGETVEIWMHSDPVLLATVTAAADGSFRTQITVPAQLAVGAHRLELRGADSGSVWADVTVTAAANAAPASGGGLADTGSRPAPWVGLALLVILGGVAVVVSARTRRMPG